MTPAFFDSPHCPHCGARQQRDSSTTLCYKCGGDCFEPNAYEKAEQEEIMRQGELEIYRGIRRGELP